MEQQKPEPDFEVPEATKQMTKGEIDLLFPPDESEEAVIYNGLRRLFFEAGKETVVAMRKTRTQQPAKKRPQTRRK